MKNIIEELNKTHDLLLASKEFVKEDS